MRLGRFTWKASVTRLRPYVAVSFLEDFGMTSALFPAENRVAAQTAAVRAPSGGAPAMTQYGPGDPGYVGGRWWVDANANGYQDEGDSFFLCPLLPPGRAP